MEPNEFFFPPTSAEYPAWVENFYTELDMVKTLLGISTEDMTRVNNIRLALNYVGTSISQYGKYTSESIEIRNIILYGDPNNPLLELVEYKRPPAEPTMPDQVAPDQNKWIVGFVGRLRKNTNMNSALSKVLGIDSRPGTAYNGEPPVLKGTVVSGQAKLNCPLKNFKGYEVWRRDTPAGDFIKIGVSLSRFFTDGSELPDGVNAAQRTYIVRMLGSDNEPVGLVSNEITLVVYRTAVPA